MNSRCAAAWMPWKRGILTPTSSWAAWCFPDGEWIEAVCAGGRSGRRVDVIPFHAYPETWTPENVTVENYLGAQFAAGFVSSTDAACGRKRLWINETGYATLPGRTEEDQARWWIRAAATFLAQPRIDHLGIYEIKDLRSNREAIGDAPNCPRADGSISAPARRT
jgi:polysaccharide biosynthesis protein PslG